VQAGGQLQVLRRWNKPQLLLHAVVQLYTTVVVQVVVQPWQRLNKPWRAVHAVVQAGA
jgi:hypothetical protein